MDYALAERIRAEYAAGGITKTALREKYDIGWGTILNILARKTHTS